MGSGCLKLAYCGAKVREAVLAATKKEGLEFLGGELAVRLSSRRAILGTHEAFTMGKQQSLIDAPDAAILNRIKAAVSIERGEERSLRSRASRRAAQLVYRR